MSHIRLSCETVHTHFDKATPPSGRVRSGDIVTFVCRDCYNGSLHTDRMDPRDLDRSCGNPITGPLYIEDAAPGDVLRIDILQIRPGPSGRMYVRPGAGLYDLSGTLCRVFPIDAQNMTFSFDGLTLPLRPMIGVIGTAPAGDRLSSECPGETGSNMDIRDMCAGSTLCLPVQVPGALLSMGDLHGVQGDGESAVCALEMAGEVTVRVVVLKDRADIPTPLLVTPTHYMTAAADPSLDRCAQAAARKMHLLLQRHTRLDAPHAAMLLSLCGNLRISQVVNPAHGCVMEFPKDILPVDLELL